MEGVRGQGWGEPVGKELQDSIFHSIEIKEQIGPKLHLSNTM